MSDRAHLIVDKNRHHIRSNITSTDFDSVVTRNNTVDTTTSRNQPVSVAIRDLFSPAAGASTERRTIAGGGQASTYTAIGIKAKRNTNKVLVSYDQPVSKLIH